MNDRINIKFVSTPAPQINTKIIFKIFVIYKEVSIAELASPIVL
jgi:hypothetical protein